MEALDEDEGDESDDDWGALHLAGVWHEDASIALESSLGRHEHNAYNDRVTTSRWYFTSLVTCRKAARESENLGI